MVKKLVRDKKGAALVEYSMLVAGIALIGAAAVSTFGHKTTDLMAAMAAILPGAHAADNGPIQSGALIEVTAAAAAPIVVDVPTIVTNTASTRLGDNLLGTGGGLETLIIEAP